MDRVGAGVLLISLIGDALAPLATTPHAHWHAQVAERRRRSWLFLWMPFMIPSAPFMTQAADMRCAKCGTKERAVKLRVRRSEHANGASDT